VNDFCHHGQSSHGPRSNARRQKQFWKILGTPIGCRYEVAVKPTSNNVARPNIVMVRHDQMREHRLIDRTCKLFAGGIQCQEFSSDPVWTK
jgi:hypothetical protein